MNVVRGSGSTRNGDLKITQSSEPLDGSGQGRRRFLLLYDAVPGGTGYVADLYRGQRLFDVMRHALGAMQTCGCRQRGKEGCYRCLYAYQDQAEIPLISRTLAETLFARILEAEDKDKASAIETLSTVSMDSVLESELEERFVQAVGKWVDDQPEWTWEAEVPYEKGTCWRIVTPERTWRLEPQVVVGKKEGVTLASRPDFVLRCISDDAIVPVAIFCDGFRYHARPYEERGGIEDDIHKRQALLDSENFWVWTVTWKDVVGPEQGSLEDVPTVFTKIDSTQQSKAAQRIGGAIADVERLSCLDQLYAFIRTPDAEQWKHAALSAMVGLLALQKALDVAGLQAVRTRLEASAEHAPVPVVGPATGTPVLLGGYRQRDWVELLGTIDIIAARKGYFGNVQPLLRLFDERAARKDPEFEASWRAFFQAWNLLQFHKGVTEVVSSEWLVAQGATQRRSDATAPTPTQRRRTTREMPAVCDDDPLPREFQTLREDFAEAEAVIELLQLLHNRKLPAPEEFEGFGGSMIQVEALLSWPEQQIAVCEEIGADDRRVWNQHGWRAFLVEDATTIADALASALAQQGQD